MSTDDDAGYLPVTFTITDNASGEGDYLWNPGDGRGVVSATNDYGEEGYPQDPAEPLSWANSATITLDPDEDSITVAISTGDPRGAFVMSIRRIPADAPDNAGRLVMSVPHPDDPLLHEPLGEIRPGAYMVGGTA